MNAPGPDQAPARSPLVRALYLVLAAAFFALAALGVALPGLPTTPFLLLLSWCLVRGSPTLDRRLKESPLFGPLLRDWEKSRGVRRHVKVTAVTMIALVAVAGVFFGDRSGAWRAGIAAAALVGLVVVLRLRTVR
jgi:uncharacterized protein